MTMTMMTLTTMTNDQSRLTEDDIAILLFLGDALHANNNRSIPIQQLHEDMEDSYGWLVLDIKASIKRLLDESLIAVAGSLRSRLALTELGKQVAKRVDEMR